MTKGGLPAPVFCPKLRWGNVDGGKPKIYHVSTFAVLLTLKKELLSANGPGNDVSCLLNPRALTTDLVRLRNNSRSRFGARVLKASL